MLLQRSDEDTFQTPNTTKQNEQEEHSSSMGIDKGEHCRTVALSLCISFTFSSFMCSLFSSSLFLLGWFCVFVHFFFALSLLSHFEKAVGLRWASRSACVTPPKKELLLLFFPF
jgi:hypothetical protein